MKRQYDLLYVEGPGDVVEAFERWSRQEDVITETSRTYSSQFFDFCRKYELRTCAMSYCSQAKWASDERFWVENRPKPLAGAGIRYHLAQILYGLFIVVKAARLRPKSINITSGVTYWWVLAPLRLLGIHLIAHMHNCLWPNGYRPSSFSGRLLLAMDGWFFRRVASAVVCVSPEIERQIKRIAGEKHCPVFQFRGQFYRQDFEAPKLPPPHRQKPFRVVFAGRIERNKGVFDMLDMAERLRAEEVCFDICGGGSALEELRREAAQRGLESYVHIHGKLSRPDLLKIYQQGHVVIVPTRSDFCEGMPMVCAEAVLLGRPVITTRLSNALDVLKGAIAEAQPDDVDSFVLAIQKLKHDADYFAALCSGCQPLREQFLDGSQGLTAVLEQTYQSLT